MYVIIDVVLIIMAVSIIWRCWSLGLVAALISLVGKAVAYVTAIVLSTPIATALYHQFFRAMTLDYVSNKLAEQGVGASMDIVNKAMELEEAKIELIAMIEQVMESAGLGAMMDVSEKSEDFISKITTGNLSMAESLVDTFIQPLAIIVVRIFVFSIIFTMVSIVVGVIFKMGRKVNRIPIIGGVNHILGGAIGVVGAIMITYIVVMCLALLATVTNGTMAWISWSVLDQTTFFTWVNGWNMPFDVNIFDLGVV